MNIDLIYPVKFMHELENLEASLIGLLEERRKPPDIKDQLSGTGGADDGAGSLESVNQFFGLKSFKFECVCAAG